MRASVLFLGILFMAQMVSSGPLEKKESKILEKIDGWAIPGLSKSHPMKIKSQSERMIEGKRIRITSLQMEDTHDDNNPREIKLPILDDSSDPAVFSEMDVFINSVTQSDIKGKTFCYLVSVSPIYGGESVGVEYYYAYYDENGDGLFRKRERVYLDYLDVKSGKELIHLPTWVKNVAQDQ